jgi:hypothetical protein
VNHKVIRLNKGILTEMAWHKAVRQGKSFTADEIAVWCHMTPNRHFRAHLNHLAGTGLLAINRRLCEDGHYRKFFYCDFDLLKRHSSIPMFNIPDKEISA